MPKAAVSRCRNTSVQKPDLLDHLVGAREQRRRHVEAKRLGSFQIDCQLVPRRQLYREFTWICSTQNAVNVRRPPRACSI